MVKTLTLAVVHTSTTETNNIVVSPKYTHTTKSHSDYHILNTNETVSHCDGPNFKLFVRLI